MGSYPGEEALSGSCTQTTLPYYCNMFPQMGQFKTTLLNIFQFHRSQGQIQFTRPVFQFHKYKAQRTWLRSLFVLAQGENREALRKVLTWKLEEMICFHLHASHWYDPFPHRCRSEFLVIWGPPAPRGHTLHFFSHVPLQLRTSGNVLSSSPSSTFSACLLLLPPARENFLLL